MAARLLVRDSQGERALSLSAFLGAMRRDEVSPHSLVQYRPWTGDRFVPLSELPVLRAPREALRPTIPWVSGALVIGQACMHLASGGAGTLEALAAWGGKVAPLIWDLGQTGRLLSANLLHRDATHFLVNAGFLLVVGAVLERAYLRQTFAALMVLSGAAAMAASTFYSPAATVGGSGMIFGALGALGALLVRLAALFGAQARRQLWETALPAGLVLAWLGWSPSGVDGAAHFGGLCAGAIFGLSVRPAALQVNRQMGWAIRPESALAVGCATALIFAGPLLESSLPRMRTERDDVAGLALEVPRGWSRAATRSGRLLVDNGLPPFARARLSVEADWVPGGADISSEIERGLAAAKKEGFLEAPIDEVAVFGIAGRGFTSRSPSGDLLEVAVAVRGEVRLVWTARAPAAFPAYGGLLARLKERARLEEPELLRTTRARVLLFPHAPWALGRLGEALRLFGDPLAASRALQQAVRQEPGEADLRSQLAIALSLGGAFEEACDASNAALLYAPGDPLALEAEARCELWRGNLEGALHRVRQARQVAPSDGRLKAAEERLMSLLAPSR